MTQRGAVFMGPVAVQIELPAADTELLPGVRWGAMEAFPSAAYWTYQVMAHRAAGKPVRYRLGETLREEIAACILGGHGIPAEVGVAAFRRVKESQILERDPSEEDILLQLREPLRVNGRSIRYRFARQKARYLGAALRALPETASGIRSGRELRDALLRLPGIGHKTASWISRNWLDADDVAILDIHIVRAGRLVGFLAPELSVPRDYLALEAQFLAFSKAVGVRASELDAVIWREMASSSLTVRELLAAANTDMLAAGSRRRAHVRRSHPNQRLLLD